MNLNAKKEVIIERFKHVNDLKLIDAIKELLDNAVSEEQVNDEIPEAHQKLVMERFDRVRKNPERLLDWEEVKKGFKS